MEHTNQTPDNETAPAGSSGAAPCREVEINMSTVTATGNGVNPSAAALVAEFKRQTLLKRQRKHAKAVGDRMEPGREYSGTEMAVLLVEDGYAPSTAVIAVSHATKHGTIERVARGRYRLAGS